MLLSPPRYTTLLCTMGLVVACGSTAASLGTDPTNDGGDILEMADGAFLPDGQNPGDSSTPLHDGGSSPMDGAIAKDSGAVGLDGGGGQDSGGGGQDSGGGGAISCPGPGSYKMNGGSCGTERWNIKTGTDPGASAISLVPQPNTIAQLVGLPAAGGGTGRTPPTETTIWELRDVTLSMIKLETDSDYHIVLSDGQNTMIAEVPYPPCASGSAWSCFISRARAEVDAKFSVSSSPQYPALTVTVRGVGFFDFKHGQTGVAPNAIELHPILEICFGAGCTPS